MSSSVETKTPEAKPRYKRKGPIRFEAIVPMGIVIALMVLYFVFFFDNHVRRGIEWAATQANGAEVNIGDLDADFKAGTLRIRKIQVTNRDLPTQNRVQVGEVRFGFLWDAALRLKFVVDDAAVEAIEVNTERSRPGRVLPPSTEGSIASKVIAELKEQISQTALGDVAALLEGFDPTKNLKDVGKNLKSAKRLAELKAELSQKEEQWSKNLASIPGEKDFQQLQSRLSAIQIGGGQNPAQIKAKVDEIQSLIREGESKVQSVEKMSGELTSDVSSFQAKVAQVDDLAVQDRKDLESMLKLPSIDPSSMAKSLFGDLVLDRFGRVERYVATARKYMPAKTAEKDPVVTRPRGEGKVYEFGRPNSYPRFWVRKASISSTGVHSVLGGDVRGVLRNASSNQPLTGLPMTIDLSGNFPKQQILGLSFQATVDHTTDAPKESFKARLESYPVQKLLLSNSPGMTLGFERALGSVGLEGGFGNGGIDLSIDHAFKQIEYAVAAESKLLHSLVRDTVREIPSVQMKARIRGSWDDLQLSIQSNLAQALAQGLQRQLQAKLAAARKQIDELIQGNISKAKGEVQGRVNQARTRVVAQVDAKKKQAAAFKSQAEAKLNEAKRQAVGEPQKKLDQIKKKFPGF